MFILSYFGSFLVIQVCPYLHLTLSFISSSRKNGTPGVSMYFGLRRYLQKYLLVPFCQTECIFLWSRLSERYFRLHVRTFHSLNTWKFGDQRILRHSGPLIHGFWGSQLLKCSVGWSPSSRPGIFIQRKNVTYIQGLLSCRPRVSSKSFSICAFIKPDIQFPAKFRGFPTTFFFLSLLGTDSAKKELTRFSALLSAATLALPKENPWRPLSRPTLS